ncbi:IS1 family transposase [Aeromonas sp. sia0103]|nr:IS1 family transposase [Aeromonas sp. sia0103]
MQGLLSPFQIGFFTSDDWGSYVREIPASGRCEQALGMRSSDLA